MNSVKMYYLNSVKMYYLCDTFCVISLIIVSRKSPNFKDLLTVREAVASVAC